MTIKEFINPARIFIKTKEGKGTSLPKYLKKISEDVYSSEEVKTNKIWVDENGVKHPIYRKKVIWNVAIGTAWVGLNLSDVGINNYGYIYFGEGTRFIYSGRYIKEVGSDQNFYFDTENHSLTTKQNDNPRVYTFILEYTKNN